MKVTEKQLQVLFRVLEGTLNMCDRTDVNLFGYDMKTRTDVYNQILNQQSEKLVNVKGYCVKMCTNCGQEEEIHYMQKWCKKCRGIDDK